MRAARALLLAGVVGAALLPATTAHATCAPGVDTVCAVVCGVDHRAIKSLCAITR